MAVTNGTGRALKTVEGVVEAINERGIKVSGGWANVSKFRPVELPDVGAHVRLEVDGRGYIQTIEVLAANREEILDLPPAADHTTTRLAVLKAAAHFAATRTDIKSADVLRIADAWLAWVERS
jgi:hypothetical protein